MLEHNAFFLARTQGVGVISRELAQDVGISGPLLRGSGVNYDIRRAEPYSSYEDFDFKVPVETDGRLLRALPRADGRVPRVDQDRPPGARRAAGGADLLAAGRQVGGAGAHPQGRGATRASKGARGEVGCYLIADGSAKPYRMKWRGASFSNLAVLPHIIPGHKVADVVAIMGSVDPVFGEVDR